MNRKLITLLLSIITNVGTLFAYDIQVGNLYYLLNEQSKTATVTYRDGWSSYNGWNGGFDITTANIPESITHPYSGQSYRVVAIGEQAFYNCKNLTSVTIPSSVSVIEQEAFRYCPLLTSVNINEGVTSIGGGAFAYCSSLGSIVLPNTVTDIKSGAFSNCSSLTNVSIPESVSSIESMAFHGCTALKVMWLPSGLSKIEDHLFMGCTNLQQVNIPLATTEIGNEAFRDCSSLKKIYWEARACATYDFGITQVEEFVFGESVEVIPNSLCKGMSFTYRWIDIPSSVQVIGDSAFCGTNLMNLYFGPRVVPEGEYSVENFCHLDSIGKDAFSNCTSLQGIICWAITPPALGEHVFNGINCREVTLNVPYKSERAYRDADQWKEFFIETVNPPSEYTITFKNWDASVLQEVQTPAGEIPQYTGETPTRESDGEFTYAFKGWKPKLIPAGGDAMYVATYDATPISEGVENTNEGSHLPTKEIRDGKILIHRGEKTYTVQGQEIKEP